MGELTSTSYAILGLLSVQSWTTYELAQQMRRGLRYMWPRAESMIYEEPKKLVAHGLAKGAKERTGNRPRTVYSITAKGRRALRAWLTTPGQPPQLEFEALVKVFFAEAGTRQDVLGSLRAVDDWAAEFTQECIDRARQHLEDSPFPQRLPQIALVGTFLTGFADMVASWSAWATSVVESWPDDPAQATPEWDAIREVATRGTRSSPAPTAPSSARPSRGSGRVRRPG